MAGLEMTIEYKINDRVSVDEFIDLLHASGLAERRPAGDRECMAGMVSGSNLIVTARDGGRLVGIARSMTDFHYACYLSDLAVDRAYQCRGVGVELQRITQSQLGQHCTLILLAAPKAVGYYPRIGYENNPNCWVVRRDQRIGLNATE